MLVAEEAKFYLRCCRPVQWGAILSPHPRAHPLVGCSVLQTTQPTYIISRRNRKTYEMRSDTDNACVLHIVWREGLISNIKIYNEYSPWLRPSLPLTTMGVPQQLSWPTHTSLAAPRQNLHYSYWPCHLCGKWSRRRLIGHRPGSPGPER